MGGGRGDYSLHYRNKLQFGIIIAKLQHMYNKMYTNKRSVSFLKSEVTSNKYQFLCSHLRKRARRNSNYTKPLEAEDEKLSIMKRLNDICCHGNPALTVVSSFHRHTCADAQHTLHPSRPDL